MSGGLGWIAACALLVAGCRSPFGGGVETGPPEDPAAVGTGVHAWPLYESVWEGDEHRTDVAWPALSLRTAAADGALVRADVLYPLFLREVYPDGSRLGLRPLFDVESRERPDGAVEDVDLLFPLVKWRRSPEKDLLRIAPVYYHERNAHGSDTVVFPIWWEGSGERRTHRIVVPFWGSETEGAFRKRWILPPLLGTGSDPDGERAEWDLLFPLFHGSRRGATSSALRLLPFWWSERDGDEGHDVLFPFWWEFRDGSRRFRMLFPFYGHGTEGDLGETTVVGGPLWISRRDGGHRGWWALAPLLHGTSDGDDWSFHLFPFLFLKRSNHLERTMIWPLYGESHRTSSVERSVAWPLFTWTHRDDGSWSATGPLHLVTLRGGGARRGGRVFPLVSWESTDGTAEGNVLWQVARWSGDGEESKFTVLWRLLDAGSTPSRRHFALRPLLRTESNERGDRHWSVLFGLVARTADADGVRWRWLWFL